MFNFLSGMATSVTLNPITIIFNLVLAFLLSLVIVWIYKRTHSGLSYSQSFVFATILLGVLITSVMMIVGSNVARAFTLLGAFTIIRFRTAVKDSRDISFLFWSIVSGMAVGTGSYALAIIMTLVLGVIILFVQKTKVTSIRSHDHILSFLLPTVSGNQNVYKDVFSRYLKNHSLLNVATRSGGEKMEFAFNVQFVDAKEAPKFIAELKNVSGMEQINLASAHDDIEY